MKSLALSATWDLTTDSSGNIAVVDGGQALAQNAASAIRLFAGELYYDITKGVPYFDQIYGSFPPKSLMKAKFVAAALTVPGVVKAQCFITAFSNRRISGQVQVTDVSGKITAASF